MSFNPIKSTFSNHDLYGSPSAMTHSGTFHKIAYLFFVLAGGVWAGWSLFTTQSPFLGLAFWGGFIGAVICALVAIFSPQNTRYTALPYAFGQGLALSIMAQYLEIRYPGIAVTAVSLSCATAFAMLILYKFEIIKVTEQLKSVIVSATAAIALTYFIVIILGLFGFNTTAFFAGSGTMSILFSLFVVGIAAFNLLLDFDLIEKGTERGLPKYMEWYAAFSLLVTLIWLYVEVLRLLLKLSRRRS